MNTEFFDIKYVLALGVSPSLVILANKLEPSDTATVLIHMFDMVKECAITAR